MKRVIIAFAVWINLLQNFNAQRAGSGDDGAALACNCPPHSVCTGAICTCAAGFTRVQHECVAHIFISCSPTSVVLQISRTIFTAFGVDSDRVNLRDPGCDPKIAEDSASIFFGLRGDVRSCGTNVSETELFITYSNVLKSVPDNDGVIMTGSQLLIPFRCSFPVNTTVTVNYTALIGSRVIPTLHGLGSFHLSSFLYEDDAFEQVQEKTTFDTTENLFVQIALETEDEDLAVVMRQCWATPNLKSSDDVMYGLIIDGCPRPSAIRSKLRVIANGLGRKARFAFQAFSFINANTVFIHCSINICINNHHSSCQSKCSSSADHREKRDLKASQVDFIQTTSLGPFFRNAENFPYHSNAKGSSIGTGGTYIFVIVAAVCTTVIWIVVSLFRIKSKQRHTNTAATSA